MTPPRLLILGILPPLLVIAWLFLSKTGRVFIDSLPLKPLIILNIDKNTDRNCIVLPVFKRSRSTIDNFRGRGTSTLSADLQRL